MVDLEVDSPAVILLSARVPTVLEARATGDRDDPRLPSDAQVGEMFVFFPQVSTGFEPNDVLEPGEAIEFEVGYHGESAGTTDITAHLHASFSFSDLFPRTNGTTVEKSVTIRRLSAARGRRAPPADSGVDHRGSMEPLDCRGSPVDRRLAGATRSPARSSWLAAYLEW